MAMWYRSLIKLSGQIPRNKILLGQSACIRSNYSSMPNRQMESPIQHHNFQIGGQLVQCRQMSSGERNFFKQFIENLKTEWAKNKEMKESLKKFREERDRLEKSESLQKVREKFDRISAEGAETSTVVKKKLEELGKRVSETLDEAQKSEIAKKGREFTEELSKSAGRVTETLYKQGESIGKSAPFRTFSEGVRAVKEEIDESTLSRGKLYKAPAKLRKRTEKKMSMDTSERTIEVNEKETSVELHKDSKWYQSWQNFKENNEYVNKFFNLKMKYDESDNVAIRATRAFTDKMSYLFGGMFSKTEMSEVLTEICKIDPNFDNQKFIMMCEQEIIPNVLEVGDEMARYLHVEMQQILQKFKIKYVKTGVVTASASIMEVNFMLTENWHDNYFLAAIMRGDLEVLKDWCYEAKFHPTNENLLKAKRRINFLKRSNSKEGKMEYSDLTMIAKMATITFIGHHIALIEYCSWHGIVFPLPSEI